MIDVNDASVQLARVVFRGGKRGETDSVRYLRAKRVGSDAF